jgi:hypothetical protein
MRAEEPLARNRLTAGRLFLDASVFPYPRFAPASADDRPQAADCELMNPEHERMHRLSAPSKMPRAEIPGTEIQ